MKSATHDRDFLQWTEEQAAALRAGDLEALDLEGLLEEIEEMTIKEYRALNSALAQVLAHLLKMQFSPAEYPRAGWKGELTEFRDTLDDLVASSGRLRNHLSASFDETWPRARRLAKSRLDEYGEHVQLPAQCPYTLDQVLDFDFYPERHRKD